MGLRQGFLSFYDFEGRLAVALAEKQGRLMTSAPRLKNPLSSTFIP